ncbi:hypothetical protein, partial [Pseudomonas sp.]|uniref:hypothetical protein n=1 Tax=Pseudomonas sp. TaxID=306 RepID=UPI003CC6BAC5
MAEIDERIQEQLRNWQFRRLEIKDQMQTHPEKTLELARVLDLMDDEHAAILSGSMLEAVEVAPDESAPPLRAQPHPAAGDGFNLQLHLCAATPGDFLKLLDLAAHELRGQINARGTMITGQPRTIPGGMSGT